MAALKFVIVDEVKHEVRLELFFPGERRHAPEKRRIVFGAEFRPQIVRAPLPAAERRTAEEKFAETAASERRIFRELRLHFSGDVQFVRMSARPLRKIRDFDHRTRKIIAPEPSEIHFPDSVVVEFAFHVSPGTGLCYRECFRYKAPNSI